MDGLRKPGDKNPPQVRRYEPVYECLGYIEKVAINGERRYVIKNKDQLFVLKAMQMHGLAFLTVLYSDVGYWRAHHPRVGRKGVDITAAMTALIRRCTEAGEWSGTWKGIYGKRLNKQRAARAASGT